MSLIGQYTMLCEVKNIFKHISTGTLCPHRSTAVLANKTNIYQMLKNPPHLSTLMFKASIKSTVCFKQCENE